MPVFVAEVSLDAIEALPGRVVQYRALARHPAIQRDLAVILPRPTCRRPRLAGRSRGSGRRGSGGWLSSTSTRARRSGLGRKSLAYGLLYQADDRTLTDAEVNRAHGEVVDRLRVELGAEVRGADGPGRGDVE